MRANGNGNGNGKGSRRKTHIPPNRNDGMLNPMQNSIGRLGRHHPSNRSVPSYLNKQVEKQRPLQRQLQSESLTVIDKSGSVAMQLQYEANVDEATSESSSDESASCCTASSGRCAVRYVGTTRRQNPNSNANPNLNSYALVNRNPSSNPTLSLSLYQGSKSDVATSASASLVGVGKSLPASASASASNIPRIDMNGDGANESVSDYLDQNPNFLESYLMKRWTLEKVEQFLRRSLSPAVSDASGGNYYLRTPSKLSPNGQTETIVGFQAHEPVSAVRRMALYAEHETLIRNLAKKIHTHHNKAEILVEMVNQVAKLIDASGSNLYMIADTKEHIFLYSDGTALPNDSSEIAPSLLTPICSGTTLAAYVAYTREPFRCDDFETDKRFPAGIQQTSQTRAIKSVIAYPLTLEDALIGVVELYRFAGRPSFSNEHEAVVASFVVWGSLTANDFQMYRKMARQKELNEFILQVTKSIFQDIVSLDNVMMKIMTFAKTLVNADRASLFLVDNKTNELFARIFDVGVGKGNSKNEFVEAKEIRFSMNKGVAGFVASTGNTLNIPDAYEDEHFNREIDVRTGYHTKTILCMPICVRGNIIGVVQMVNKLGDGAFTKADEEAFDLFAVYCGLALHHAKLYDKIRRSEQKYKVAIEVLSYHSQASDDEVRHLKALLAGNVSKETLLNFHFDPWSLSNDDKPLMVVVMFRDLFQMQNLAESDKFLDQDTLIRFILTVRKNYRNVPYHNWVHAFSVAHTMYAMVKLSESSAQKLFSPLEVLSLFVSCVCHDIDHRGRTNSYMVKSATPLAALYSTSTMEQHHFNYTISILQNEGHNIFRYLSSEDYKRVLDNMKHCILATDLALFFGNKSRLKELLDSNTFDPTAEDQRKMVQAIVMTSCDLVASAKPWHVQMSTVNVIFEEFYAQGDEEKLAGQQPIKMMDRQYKNELAEQQVGFIQGICLPCYELLARFLPQITPLVEGARSNLERWKQLADEHKREKEANKSIT